MKVLVYPFNLELGGSMINAVDLAAAVRDRGHDVVIFSQSGPLNSMVAERQLRLIEAPAALGPRPSPVAAWRLRQVVRQEKVDLVHAWEGYSFTEAFYGAHLLRGTPVIGTLYTMHIDGYLPRTLPMIAGTRELQRLLRENPVRSKWNVEIPLLDPPIDVEWDTPSIDPAAFRAEHGLDDDIFTIVVVSRLDHRLKLEGLSDAMEAVARIAGRHVVRLVIVGDGPARDLVEAKAASVNDQLGRTAVVLAGASTDPRPAYAAADLVVGQGTSALRAMAIGKPVIVTGDRGFYQIVSPETVEPFFELGFWGRGSGGDGAAVLAGHMETMLEMEPAARHALGVFGRKLVVDRFSLQGAAADLEQMYLSCVAGRPALPPRRVVVAEAASTAARVVRFKFDHRVAKVRAAREGRSSQFTED